MKKSIIKVRLSLIMALTILSTTLINVSIPNAKVLTEPTKEILISCDKEQSPLIEKSSIWAENESNGTVELIETIEGAEDTEEKTDAEAVDSDEKGDVEVKDGEKEGLYFIGEDNELNIFTVSEDMLKEAKIKFQVPETSTVLINVTGESIIFPNEGGTINDNNLENNTFCSQIIWNLYEATEVSNTGDIYGSVLAVNAKFKVNDTPTVYGEIVVAAIDGQENIKQTVYSFKGIIEDEKNHVNTEEENVTGEQQEKVEQEEIGNSSGDLVVEEEQPTKEQQEDNEEENIDEDNKEKSEEVVEVNTTEEEKIQEAEKVKEEVKPTVDVNPEESKSENEETVEIKSPATGDSSLWITVIIIVLAAAILIFINRKKFMKK